MARGKNIAVFTLNFATCKFITLRKEYNTYVVCCQLTRLKNKLYIKKFKIILTYDNGTSFIVKKAALHRFIHPANPYINPHYKQKAKKGCRHRS